MESKAAIIKKVQEERCGSTWTRNSMGCSENWYNPYYAIGQTFTDEELMSMSEKELNNLYLLADKIGDGLY